MFHRAKGAITAAVFVTGSLCLHAGCEDDPVVEELAALGEGCLLDSDCDDPLVCVFRRCHYQCETTPDCHDTYGLDPLVNCVLGDKPTNVCQLDSEISCEVEGLDGLLASSRCPGEQVCGVDGTCRDACGSDSDCVAGDVCVQGTCAHEGELNEDGLLTDPDVKTPEGAPCSYTSECEVPLVCLDHTCSEACLQSVDCPDGKVCVLDDATQKHICQAPTSPGEPLTCGNEAKDGDESDVDCGGACLPCSAGSLCNGATDCSSSLCDDGVCASPACDDGVKNGSETGEDCGGTCAPCPPASPCVDAADCTTGLCVENVCYDEGCGDELVDGDESDIDCGGACPPCEVGATCFEPGDCADGVCEAFACAQGDCSDAITNNGEKAVDCGGPCSLGCGLGAPCDDAGDCESEHCDAGSSTCSAPSCSDAAQNGFETDVDCGGGCPPCGLGEVCADDADCNGPSEACEPALLECAALHTVTVLKSGGGAGSVTSTPTGLIDCGSICTVDLFAGTQLSLTAAPGPGSSFGGFLQGCVGPTCALTVTADTTVEATFSGTIGSYQRTWGVQWGLNAATALAFDATEGLFTSGPVNAAANFGGGTLTKISGAGSSDVYVAHYGPSGDHVWSYNFANSAAPSNSFAPIGIAADASGHAVVAVAANGSLRLNGSTLLPCGTSSLALFRLAASNGAFMSGACHGQDITGATDMLLAANGDIIVVGSFTDSVDLGGGTIASAGTHAFIARYDGATLAYESGAVLGGGAMRSVRRIARSAGGDFVLSGSCVGVADFGGGVVSANPQGDGTSEDFCVVKLSSTLSPQWVFQRGDNGADLAQAADFLPNGEVVVMGRFLQLVDFGEGFLHNGGTGRVVMLRLSGASGALADPVLGQSVQVLGPECDAPVEIVGLTTSASGDFHVTGQATGCSGADLGAGPIGYFVTRFSSFGVHASTLGTNAGFVGFDLARSPSGLIAFSGHTQLGNNSPTDTFGLGPIGGYGEPFVVRWVP